MLNSALDDATSENDIKRIFAKVRRKPPKKGREYDKEYEKFAKKTYYGLERAKNPFMDWFGDYVDNLDSAIAGLENYIFVGVEVANDIEPTLGNLFDVGWKAAGDVITADTKHEIETAFASDFASDWAKKYGGSLITRLDDSTRDMIRATIQSSVKEQETFVELKQRLLDNYAFSEKRAETIARTESAIAYNVGAVQCWRESGLVESVYVVDGDFDEECQAANGQTWTLEEAEDNPIEHPNCVREFYPVYNENVNFGGDEE